MGIKQIIKGFLSKFPVVDGVFRRLVWSRIHFPEVEMRFINSLPRGSVDVSIDVGAALGAYAWILNRVSNCVYAFEPGRVHYGYLRNVNYLTNISLIRAAVGSVAGDVNLYTPGTDTNARHSATVSEHNPIIDVNAAYVDRVSQVKLDEFLSSALPANRSVDILKVDVEGYELEVFIGAEKTLNTFHPLIICEIEARHNSEYAKVFELLCTLGYESYIYRDGQYQLYDGKNIEELQSASDLDARLQGNYDPASNKYINNFVFQHKLSKIKVFK